jgi:nitroimidazol reductase NimA-like FMN-containing flavoprotein (pyridoxamine 5'-phosphate oxidase superfamily)
MDNNNQMLPLAFAFIENENIISWYWFLECVKAQVIGSRPHVCLIIDIHSSILIAILQLQRG